MDQDDTTIRVDGRLIDLTYIPTPKFVKAYNAYLAMADATGRAIPQAFVNTKDKFVRQGIVIALPNGTLRQII